MTGVCVRQGSALEMTEGVFDSTGDVFETIAGALEITVAGRDRHHHYVIPTERSDEGSLTFYLGQLSQ